MRVQLEADSISPETVDDYCFARVRVIMRDTDTTCTSETYIYHKLFRLHTHLAHHIYQIDRPARTWTKSSEATRSIPKAMLPNNDATAGTAMLAPLSRSSPFLLSA